MAPQPTSTVIGLDPGLAQQSLAPQQPSAITPTDETIGGTTWEYDSGIGNIEPRSAIVAFDTNEPTTGLVRYGASCDALVDSAGGGGFSIN